MKRNTIFVVLAVKEGLWCWMCCVLEFGGVETTGCCKWELCVVGACALLSLTTLDRYPLSYKIYDLVMAQTGLFLGGGDQARIMTAWRKADGTGKAV